MRARDQTTRELPVTLPPPPLGVVVRVLNARAKPAEVRLTTGSLKLGAGRDADVVIRDDTVSRLHAELTLVPEGVALRDLGSRNGTFYLDQRVKHVVLGLGSRIRIGTVDVLLAADQDSLEHATPDPMGQYGELIGSSLPMRQLFSVLKRLEGSLASVIIEGESGTGKELIARAIHRHSKVSHGPFVAVNCGAMDRALARSELFGHKRGAFTGALEHRTGVFETASDGTLFLDEIGELPLDVQPILLRALEVGAVTRLGETKERPVSVRLIGATHRDLGSDVKSGRFREDLYYRLTVVKLLVPPLRQRPGDMEHLARHFADQVGLGPLPDEVMTALRGHAWPGNIRELKHALHAYAAVGTLPFKAERWPTDLRAALHRFIQIERPYAEQKLQLQELFLRTYLEMVLEHTGGSRVEAARISGIERSYISKLIGKLQGDVNAELLDGESDPGGQLKTSLETG